jgi:TonB family protein
MSPMPILQLPTNPSRPPDRNPDRNPDRSNGKTGDAAGDPADDQTAANLSTQTLKVRTGRYGELEAHEIIHLLDSLDEENARARFRESVYISTLFFFALAWFLFYGPRVLFHQPEYKDPIALMKEHDKELTYITPPKAPALKPPHPVLDSKTLQQLQQQEKMAPPTPQPPVPAPQPPEEAHNTPPPVPQPQAPLPAAPKPAQPTVEAPLPAAPRPSFAQNTPSARDALRNAMQGPMPGAHSGVEYGPPPTPGGKSLGNGYQILSDTQGVDFTAYLRRVVADTKRNWEPLIPEEVQAPLLKKGFVGIRFSILPDGNIGEPMILETPSGDQALDRAAWNAITSEGQFPPLPKEFHGPKLELRFGFYYNLQPQQ